MVELVGQAKGDGVTWLDRLVMNRREKLLYEFADLAQYNSEKARGVVHTAEWDEKMAKEQERFKEYRAKEGA